MAMEVGDLQASAAAYPHHSLPPCNHEGVILAKSASQPPTLQLWQLTQEFLSYGSMALGLGDGQAGERE